MTSAKQTEFSVALVEAKVNFLCLLRVLYYSLFTSSSHCAKDDWSTVMGVANYHWSELNPGTAGIKFDDCAHYT